MRSVAVCLFALSSVACVGSISEPSATEVLAEWELVAGEDLSLRDPSGRQTLGYPNPYLCERLEVAVTGSGELRGRCHDRGKIRAVEGGPVDGIPYLVDIGYTERGLVGTVNDVYGVEVLQLPGITDACATLRIGADAACEVCADDNGAVDLGDCQEMIDELLENGIPDGDICVDIDLDGYDTCTVCHGPSGLTRTDSCEQIADDIRATIDAKLDGCWELDTADGICTVCTEGGEITMDGNCEQIVTSFDFETGNLDPGSLDLGDLARLPGGTFDADDPCLQAGKEAYIAEVNRLLAEEGLGPAPIDADDIGGFGAPMCAAVPGWLEPSLDSGEGYARADGRVSCGLLGRDALTGACGAAQGDCADSMAFAAGVGAAYMAWSVFAATNAVTSGFGDFVDLGDFGFGDPPAGDSSDTDGGPEGEVPEVPEDQPFECVASPLAFDLTGAGVTTTSVRDGVQFDLLGTGRPVQTAWLAAGALLTLDLDADGTVDSGRELFGEATPLASGLPARHGFEALAQYDRFEHGGNDDGQIDIGDSIFPLLGLWTDSNRDGSSSPAELTSVIDAGIEAISLAPIGQTWVGTDSARGKTIGIEGTFLRADGSHGTVVDVWLDSTSAKAPAS